MQELQTGAPDIEQLQQVAVRLATFDQHRSLLFSIAYRMLGSVADAEDMLQEAFIRWQEAREEHVRSPRAFLVTIISRLCITHLRSARVRREEYVGQWLSERLVTNPGNDPLQIIQVDESLSMAFLVLLERLTPVERAIFLLREVFEYEYSDISSIVGHSEANCRQILRRARQHVNNLRPRFKASSQKRDDLLDRFLRAATNGDMDALLTLLSKDAVLHADGGGKAIAVPNVIEGAEKVARGVVGALRKFVPKEVVRRQMEINGDPGLVSYLDGKPFSAVSLAISDGRIRAIYIVTNPEKLEHVPKLMDKPE